MTNIPNILEQQLGFNQVFDQNERELINTGFVEVLQAEGVDVTEIDGVNTRIGIERSYVQASELANIDIDLDPTSPVIETRLGIMVVRHSPQGRMWRKFALLSRLPGDQEFGLIGDQPHELDTVQQVTLITCAERLMALRRSDAPHITRSLTRVDSAGD